MLDKVKHNSMMLADAAENSEMINWEKSVTEVRNDDNAVHDVNVTDK